MRPVRKVIFTLPLRYRRLSFGIVAGIVWGGADVLLWDSL